MPYSYVQYTGTGTAPLLSVPFPYLLKAHVRLYTGYDLLTDTWTAELIDGVGFTWTSATLVQLSSNLANGVVLTIIRKTPTNTRLVDWNDASNLLAGDMDTADLQTLYAVQEQRDRVVLAAAVADAASDAVSGVVLYTPVINVAAIPATPASGSRIELIDSTGIEGFSPLSGRPVGFVGSDQLRVRMSWDDASGTWVWGSYFTTDPDGRYVRQSSISNSTSSTSQTTVASSLAVKTAKDSADTAKATADAAQAAADTAKATADAAQAAANNAWQPVDATTTSKGIVQLADAAAISAGTAGRVVDAAQLKASTPGAATTAASGLVQLADAAAISAGTAGRVVDAAQLKTATSSSGDKCKAWVNFDGTTSPISIRASFNVSSITDLGVGIYEVNFTTPMPDANYAFSVGFNNQNAAFARTVGTQGYPPSPYYLRLILSYSTGNNAQVNEDTNLLTVAIFR